MFFGIILGILLTVGAAYAFDQLGGSRTLGRPVVNWDVAAHHARTAISAARDAWTRLTSRSTSSGG